MLNNTLYMGNAAPAGTQIGTLEVGTLVKMNINGAPWEWRIVHQGLPGDMYDSSCDGCWLLLENIYETRQWNSKNENGYGNSTIYPYVNGDFFARLDVGIQSQVKEVKIPYRPGTGTGENVSSGGNGLLCKAFLLSSTELGFVSSNSYKFPIEGSKLSYFQDCNENPVSDEGKRVAKMDGTNTAWATRTPDRTFPASNDFVGTSGRLNFNSATTAYGIRPALILPSTAKVDDDLNLIA